MRQFKQSVSSRKVYHCHIGKDGEHHPASKPIWQLEHMRGGEPSPHALADLETAVDGLSARLVAHALPGVVRVTVTVSPHERTTWSDSFEVQIEPAPHIAEQAINFTQSRNAPL